VDYTSTCTYDAASNLRKQELVGGFLKQRRPATVVDMGCNTGVYSLLAADCGAKVVAFDQDPDAVDALYRRVREQPRDITPMVIDLSNPSPAIGYCNVERTSFLERVQGECVLALALVHHLLITGNLSVAAVRDLLARLTTSDLVVEFVPEQDPMYVQLCKRRVGPPVSIKLAEFLDVFRQRFDLLEEHTLPNARTLLLMHRHD
jgi:ribosomal protein L11 methylase PrmA